MTNTINPLIVRILEGVKFAIIVYREFYHNQGLLLAGAVAYYTLLSIIPIALLFVIALSGFISEDQLIALFRNALGAFGDSQANAITAQVETAYENRERIGLIGIGSLFFFSGLAFRTLQTAIAALFNSNDQTATRATWLEWLIPYLYVLGLAVSFAAVTVIAGLMDAFADRELRLFGYTLSSAQFGSFLLEIGIIVGEVVLFSLIYHALPVQKVLWRYALVGGLVATFLWEVARRIVVWFSTTISAVDILYGSFATLIILFLALEVAAIILLFGAQFIAVYSRK